MLVENCTTSQVYASCCHSEYWRHRFDEINWFLQCRWSVSTIHSRRKYNVHVYKVYVLYIRCERAGSSLPWMHISLRLLLIFLSTDMLLKITFPGCGRNFIPNIMEIQWKWKWNFQRNDTENSGQWHRNSRKTLRYCRVMEWISYETYMQILSKCMTTGYQFLVQFRWSLQMGLFRLLSKLESHPCKYHMCQFPCNCNETAIEFL